MCLILVYVNLEVRNVEQIKSCLKVYRKKLIFDVEFRVLVFVLLKYFLKIDFDLVDYVDSCLRRVECLLLLVEEGDFDFVKEFLNILKNFGYYDIVELFDFFDVYYIVSMCILVIYMYSIFFMNQDCKYICICELNMNVRLFFFY